MITPLKIARATMTDEKKRTDRIRPFAYYIGRPISYVFTVPFLYTKITPNMITVLSILFALAGFVVNSIYATQLMLTVGWILFFLWNIFDGVDGNVARYRKQFSPLGTAIDAMGGYVCVICMLFSGGIAAYNMTNVLDVYLPWDKIALIICGGFAALFNIFPRLMLYFIKATVKSDEDVKNAGRVNDKRNYGFVKIVALNIMAPSDGMMLLYIAAIWLNALDIYTYAYFVLSFLGMMASLFVMFKPRKNKVKETEKDEPELQSEPINSENDIMSAESN